MKRLAQEVVLAQCCPDRQTGSLPARIPRTHLVRETASHPSVSPLRLSKFLARPKHLPKATPPLQANRSQISIRASTEITARLPTKVPPIRQLSPHFATRQFELDPPGDVRGFFRRLDLAQHVTQFGPAAGSGEELGQRFSPLGRGAHFAGVGDGLVQPADGGL